MCHFPLTQNKTINTTALEGHLCDLRYEAHNYTDGFVVASIEKKKT